MYKEGGTAPTLSALIERSQGVSRPVPGLWILQFTCFDFPVWILYYKIWNHRHRCPWAKLKSIRRNILAARIAICLRQRSGKINVAGWVLKKSRKCQVSSLDTIYTSWPTIRIFRLVSKSGVQASYRGTQLNAHNSSALNGTFHSGSLHTNWIAITPPCLPWQVFSFLCLTHQKQMPGVVSVYTHVHCLFGRIKFSFNQGALPHSASKGRSQRQKHTSNSKELSQRTINTDS